MRSAFRTLLLLLIVPVLAACPPTGDDDDATGDDDDASVPFRIWSPDHVDVGADVDPEENPHDCEVELPPEFSCLNTNPEIRWEGAPDGTAAFALIFDDPTAGNFAHWAIYNIPGDLDGLDAGISGGAGANDLPDGAMELPNDAGPPIEDYGYLGSCPNPGFINEYSWRLYALEASLDGAYASFGELEDAAEDASLEMTSMCHVFDGDNRDL